MWISSFLKLTFPSIALLEHSLMSRLAVIEHLCCSLCVTCKVTFSPSTPRRWFRPEDVPTLSWCTDKMPTEPSRNWAEATSKSTRNPSRYCLGSARLSRAAVTTVILSHLCWALGYFRPTCVLEMILCKILKKYMSEMDFENYCSWSVSGINGTLCQFPWKIANNYLFNQQKLCPFAHYRGLALCVSCCLLSPNRVSLHMIILQRMLMNKEIRIS